MAMAGGTQGGTANGRTLTQRLLGLLALLALRAQSAYRTARQLSVLLLWVPAVLSQLSRQVLQSVQAAAQRPLEGFFRMLHQLRQQVHQALQQLKFWWTHQLQLRQQAARQHLQNSRQAAQQLLQQLQQARAQAVAFSQQARQALLQAQDRLQESLRSLPLRAQLQAARARRAAYELVLQVLHWLLKALWPSHRLNKRTQSPLAQRLRLLLRLVSESSVRAQTQVRSLSALLQGDSSGKRNQ